MNLVLMLSVVAWAMAQMIKVAVQLIKNKKFDFRVLTGSGGMPSSHTAIVCSCATATGMLLGFQSPAFAIAVVTALVVMYDAANVRKEAGEQAKILNYMMDHWGEMAPALFSKELKELLGHTPLQVVMGAILGILVGVFGVVWLG